MNYTATEFEKEIQKISPKFSVVENPNRPGLSNIFYDGKNFDLPVISTHLIKPSVDTGHRYQFPNGMFGRFWSQGEITDRLHAFLKDLKKGDYEGYTDEAAPEEEYVYDK